METLTHAPVLARFGYAVSDPSRARIPLALADSPGYPSELADSLGVSRQSMSNHLTCLRGCGLVVAVPDGRNSLVLKPRRRPAAGHHLLALANRATGPGIEPVGASGVKNALRTRDFALAAARPVLGSVGYSPRSRLRGVQKVTR